MTVFTRLVTLAVFFGALAPFTNALQGEEKSCASNEFWYEAKGICLPYGEALLNSTAPPKNRECPPAGFYWSKNLGCCVPNYPPSTDASNPPPQCPVGWSWYPALHVCLPYTPDQTHKPTPSAHPSGVPSSVPSGTPRRKRDVKPEPISLCPKGLSACPISSGGDFECLNTTEELESCGGCASTGEGQDCTAIKGAWNVGCEYGRCAVYSCFAGYKRSRDGSSCVPL